MSRLPTFLVLSLLVAATIAHAAPRVQPLTADDVDTQGYRLLFLSQQPPPRSGARFSSWRTTIDLDELETIEQRLALELRVTRPRGAPIDGILPVVVIDAAMGAYCEGSGVTVVEIAAPAGFEHLGAPRACAIEIPDGIRTRGGNILGTVTAHTPRPEHAEDRVALALPVQPFVHPADLLEIGFEYHREHPPRIRAQRWVVELGRQVLDAERERTFVALAGVSPLPIMEGASTVVGRVPTLLVDSGESWDDVAVLHAAFYDHAARAQGKVLRMAGAVLAQPDVPAAALEAVIQALDGTALDPSGGTGGAWRLPLPALDTAEAGTGTAADRAALLVALLRTADVRAEVLLLSGSALPVGPDEPLPLLDTTLVVVPKGAPSGDDLYVDPTRGSLWLGSLREELLDRDALLLGASGARWVRTPGDVPSRSWTLNATERPDGDFDIQVRGELTGAPAARLREWLVAGRDPALRPSADLAWLGGVWAEALSPRFHSPDGVRLVIRADGQLPRALALDGDRLRGPVVPAVAPAVAAVQWPYARDADRLELELLESWTFRGVMSGPALPAGDKVTPFWSVKSEGAWSGPVLTRRSHLRFSARELPRAASVEAERFASFVADLLDGVLAPPNSSAR